MLGFLLSWRQQPPVPPPPPSDCRQGAGPADPAPHLSARLLFSPLSPPSAHFGPQFRTWTAQGWTARCCQHPPRLTRCRLFPQPPPIARAVKELDRMGVDREVLARRAVESYLQQLLTHGFFHAGAPGCAVLGVEWHALAVAGSTAGRACWRGQRRPAGERASRPDAGVHLPARAQTRTPATLRWTPRAAAASSTTTLVRGGSASLRTGRRGCEHGVGWAAGRAGLQPGSWRPPL